MNLLLTATNASRKVTNFLGLSKRVSIKGLPLGTADGTDTGEIAVKVLAVGGSVSPSVTAAKNVFTLANKSDVIAAGFISAQFQVGAGATLVIDGMTLTEGQTIYYAPSSKLHAQINYTVSGGTVYGYFEY